MSQDKAGVSHGVSATLVLLLLNAQLPLKSSQMKLSKRLSQNL
jgi:hypothetical protein